MAYLIFLDVYFVSITDSQSSDSKLSLALAVTPSTHSLEGTLLVCLLLL